MLNYETTYEKSNQELCSGVFWVISDSRGLADHLLLSFVIPCDTNGSPVGIPAIALNAKRGNTYNHKRLWEIEIRGNPAHKHYSRKPYDHYPRGRVEVANNKATIYLNPNINEARFIDAIKQRFGLSEYSIREVRVVNDNSSHYRCFMDREGD